MKEIRVPIFALALTIISLLIGCATFKFNIPENYNPTLHYVKFCKGIIRGEIPSEVKPIEEGKTFTPDVEKIWLLICLGHLEGHHTMQWRWYAPDGNLFANTGEFTISPEGEFHRLATIWDYLSIDGLAAEKVLGKWTVAIFLDDKLIATSHFVISK